MMDDTVCVNAHDRCYGGASGPCPYCERRPIVAAQQAGEYPAESKFLRNGYTKDGKLPADQMHCPECGSIATSDSVDVGVGLYIRGNYACECGWEYDADGKMNVGAYEDWFVEWE